MSRYLSVAWMHAAIRSAIVVRSCDGVAPDASRTAPASTRAMLPARWRPEPGEPVASRPCSSRPRPPTAARADSGEMPFSRIARRSMAMLRLLTVQSFHHPRIRSVLLEAQRPVHLVVLTFHGDDDRLHRQAPAAVALAQTRPVGALKTGVEHDRADAASGERKLVG